jgi:hypothetical protein
MNEEYQPANKSYFILRTDTRKRKTETLIMKKFLRELTSEGCPKKEYVRCKVIRSHKKLIRIVINGKTPSKGLVKYNPKDKNELKAFRQFQDHLNDHIEELEIISATDSGPLTDGKNKRSAADPNALKSFNNNFCKSYFNSKAVRESFYLMAELVFNNFDPEVLIKKFGFYCCSRMFHTLECFEKWMLLKFYLQEEIFSTLGVDKVPFSAVEGLLPPIDLIYELKGLGFDQYVDQKDQPGELKTEVKVDSAIE